MADTGAKARDHKIGDQGKDDKGSKAHKDKLDDALNKVSKNRFPGRTR